MNNPLENLPGARAFKPLGAEYPNLVIPEDEHVDVMVMNALRGKPGFITSGEDEYIRCTSPQAAQQCATYLNESRAFTLLKDIDIAPFVSSETKIN